MAARRGSFLPGVTRNKRTGRFRARICMPGNGLQKVTGLGIFATEKEAHEAYKQARKKHYPDQMDNLDRPVKRTAEQKRPIPTAKKKRKTAVAAAKKGRAAR